MEGQYPARALIEGPREHLTDEDRRVVRETREELIARPRPSEGSAIGCPAAVLGAVVLVGWPRIADLIPGGSFVTPFVVLGGLALLLLGPIRAFTAAPSAFALSSAAVEAALRQLEYAEVDRETTLRAATVLVRHAYVSSGPTMTATFKPAEVAPRIGSAMALVVAVEEYLVTAFDDSPIFSLALGGD